MYDNLYLNGYSIDRVPYIENNEILLLLWWDSESSSNGESENIASYPLLVVDEMI